MKILIVDNDAALARVIGRICGGHEVTIVTDPTLALGLVRLGARFDAILCDQNMPGRPAARSSRTRSSASGVMPRCSC